MDDHAAIVKAREIGERMGEDRASSFFDGNTSIEEYERFLIAYEEDNESVLAFADPVAPLSGEWADSYMLVDLRDDLAEWLPNDETAWTPDCQELFSDASSALEMAFDVAYWAKLVDLAYGQVAESVAQQLDEAAETLRTSKGSDTSPVIAVKRHVSDALDRITSYLA